MCGEVSDCVRAKDHGVDQPKVRKTDRRDIIGAALGLTTGKPKSKNLGEVDDIRSVPSKSSSSLDTRHVIVSLFVANTGQW